MPKLEIAAAGGGGGGAVKAFEKLSSDGEWFEPVLRVMRALRFPSTIPHNGRLHVVSSLLMVVVTLAGLRDTGRDRERQATRREPTSTLPSSQPRDHSQQIVDARFTSRWLHTPQDCASHSYMSFTSQHTTAQQIVFEGSNSMRSCACEIVMDNLRTFSLVISLEYCAKETLQSPASGNGVIAESGHAVMVTHHHPLTLSWRVCYFWCEFGLSKSPEGSWVPDYRSCDCWPIACRKDGFSDPLKPLYDLI
ncbi:hypothetical protein TcWFU_009558 [Taenia crassiceps]|uniref:Uncharacterized protein n=1 Tax=Taenia crassiceps TaxID=6207 RepID=A0ABR4Q8P7_9CEST